MSASQIDSAASNRRYFNNLSLTSEAADDHHDDKNLKKKIRSAAAMRIEYPKTLKKLLLTENSSADPKITHKQQKALDSFHRTKLFHKYVGFSEQGNGISSVGEAGGIEVEDEVLESTLNIDQGQILASASLMTKAKTFELMLPDQVQYTARFSPTGQNMLIAGKLGHLANFEWQSKHLTCEFNVNERVNDVRWIVNDTMFAAAQKYYTYVYDKKGTELHAIKQFDCAQHLEYLPYHYLLTSLNDRSYLSYFDVSVGKPLASFSTATPSRPTAMCQNPSNAIINLGHSNGTVTMWSPKSEASSKPLVSLLAHPCPLSQLAVSKCGTKLFTTGVDLKLRQWDLRNHYKPLQSLYLGKILNQPVSCMAVSQRNYLAVSSASKVLTLRPSRAEGQQSGYEMYIQHEHSFGSIASLEFPVYEDFLLSGMSCGVETICVPGSSHLTVDSLGHNPLQLSKTSRRNMEVRQVLDKIDASLIDIDNSAIGKVNVKSVREQMQERNNVEYLRKKNLVVVGKRKEKKMRGKGKDSAVASSLSSRFFQKVTEKRKDAIVKQNLKEYNKKRNNLQHESKEETKTSKNEIKSKKLSNPLDIFRG
ncbi:MAG: putative U3 small nucleolar RNA-associated protein 7 [Marteilia pararefringens]